jgi:hypothetical protein
MTALAAFKNTPFNQYFLALTPAGFSNSGKSNKVFREDKEKFNYF